LLLAFSCVFGDGLPKEAPTNDASLPLSQSPDMDEHDDY